MIYCELLKQRSSIVKATGKANGAYIKLDNEALWIKVFNRNLMEVDEAFYDELIAYVDHKVKRRELGLNKQQVANLLGLA